MKLRTLAAAALFAQVSVSMAQAATFTVNGADYDVTHISGLFEDNRTLLEAQPWWGDAGLASDFALEVGGDIGEFFSFSPFFVHAVTVDQGTSTFYASTTSAPDFAAVNNIFLSRLDLEWTWAVATPVASVPLPAGSLLLLSGLGGIAAFNRKKKRAG